MARRSNSSGGWRILFLLLAAAVVVVCLFVIFVLYVREPLSQTASQLAATVTAVVPLPPPPSTVTPAPPSPRPTPTPAPATGTDAQSGFILFVEPEAGREPVLKGMELATRSIDMVMYLLLDDPIVEGLIKAHKRGVQVRVMYEPDPFGGGNIEPELNLLRAAGVQVKASRPTFRFTHQKTMVIDGKVAYIMTLNQTASAFTRNREYGIITGEPRHVQEILAVYEADWNRTPIQVQDPDLVWSPYNSREKLVALIASAQRTLEIQTEVMSDDQVINTLLDRARRGVKVRVVMSPPEDASSSEEGLARLTQGGVGVKLIRSPYIHAKLVLVDGTRGWIGSENFSDNSLDNNRELGILLRNPDILKTLAATFEQDWAK